jgi:hypothetical protein
MGRWAQRTRRGGGPGTRPPPTITIINVTVDTPAGEIDVEFSAAVDVADFTPANFTDVNFVVPADTVNQDVPTILRYTGPLWADNVFTGDTWLFSDLVADVVTPQTGLIS